MREVQFLTSMAAIREIDYNYKYPLNALRYNKIEIQVRKMRIDEMPEDGITYYCEVNGTIYAEGEPDFKIV